MPSQLSLPPSPSLNDTTSTIVTIYHYLHHNLWRTAHRTTTMTIMQPAAHYHRRWPPPALPPYHCRAAGGVGITMSSGNLRHSRGGLDFYFNCSLAVDGFLSEFERGVRHSTRNIYSTIAFAAALAVACAIDVRARRRLAAGVSLNRTRAESSLLCLYTVLETRSLQPYIM